jgi:RNA polymerase sigma-70 factor, ECF subfamily
VLYPQAAGGSYAASIESATGLKMSGSVTELLKAMNRGETGAAEELLPLVYAELHRLACGYMRRERRDHTLQPTALINEAYLRLARGSVDWQSRAHFIGVAATLMRRILVDHARAHLAAVRGGKARRVEFEETFGLLMERSKELIALDDALPRLEALFPRQARVVELRYVGGLTFEEIGVVLGISARSAKRDWALARMWLFEAVGISHEGEG